MKTKAKYYCRHSRSLSPCSSSFELRRNEVKASGRGRDFVPGEGLPFVSKTRGNAARKAGLIIVPALIILFASLFASSRPDALEYVLTKFGFNEKTYEKSK